MKPITNLLILGVLCLWFPLQAQVTTSFTPSNPNPAVNSQQILDLKATGITNVVSIQFPITYNSSVLRFDTIINPAIPGFSQANYTVLHAQGRITISWFADPGQFPNGITLPANSTLFQVQFTGLINGTTVVNLANVPPGIEIVNANGQNQTVNFQAGGSTVKVGTGGSGFTGFKIIANTIFIPEGDTMCMPVTVNDFDTIVAMQYATHWNPAVLQYVNTRAYNLPGLSQNSFNLTNSSTLVMLWDDVSTLGVTRPDLASIYEICFKAVGPAGSSSLVNFDSVGLQPGTPADATNARGVNVWTPTTPITDTIFVVAPPPDPNAVTFRMPDTTATIGQQTCLPVVVDKFVKVVSIQLGISYQQANLQFQSIQLGSNPLGLTLVSNFNTMTPGRVTFSWLDPNVSGVTLADNTTIFSVCYTGIGPNGTTTPVNFTGFPPSFPIEVAVEPTGPINPNLRNSTVTLSNVALAVTVDTVKHVTCPGGNNASIEISVSGGTNYTYQWSGPCIVAGLNSNLEDPFLLCEGTYTVTVTAAGGLTATATVTVNAPAPIAPNISVTKVDCFGGSNGAINIAPTGGTAPYFYNWTGPSIPPNSPTSEDQLNLKAGNYRFTLTDTRGCQYVSPQIQVAQGTQIQVTGTPVVTNASCFGANDGAISINIGGGSGGYSYMWMGPAGFTSMQKDIANLAAGVYNLTVTDNLGCTSGNNISISVAGPASPLSVALVSSNNVKCFGTASGTANVSITGGMSPFTYTWRNTMTNMQVSNVQNPANFTPGTYSLVVTDAGNCTATLPQNVVIQGPPAAISASHTKTDATCPAGGTGGSTGSINLTVSGGWPGGAPIITWIPSLPGGANPTGLPAGVYTPIVTDVGGCVDTLDAITIGGPPPISFAQINIANVQPCAGDANGSISVTPMGGAGAPYTISWTGGFTGNQITGLSGGNYTPLVTDGAGCTVTLSPVNVFEPSPINVSSVQVTNVTGSMNNGAITMSFAGGAMPYGYAWSGPGGFVSGQKDISGLAPGNYILTLTDALGCVFVTSYNVMSDVGVMVVSVKPSCGDDGCVTLSLTPSAVAPFTVAWTGVTSGSFQTSMFTVEVCGLQVGNYNITVTDANNNAVVVPTQNIPALQPAIVSSQETNPNDAFKNGSIILEGFPASAPYDYVWNDGAVGFSRMNLDSGTYCVTVTNLNSGCTAVRCFKLTRTYPPFQFFSNVTNADCGNAANGAIVIFVSGGDGPTYTFEWEGPNGFSSTDQNISNLAPGVYTVTVTDESLIEYVRSVTINTQSLLAISNVNVVSNYNGFQVSGADECDGEAIAVITGQVGNVTVTWSNGQSGLTGTDLCAGAYSVTVVDGLGCQAVWSDSLFAPLPLAGSTQGVTNFGGFSVKCHGDCNAIVRVRVSGGVPPYEVQWPNGAFDVLNSSTAFSQVGNLCGGDYEVTVTDRNSVLYLYKVTVSEPAPLIAEFAFITPSRFTTCDGELLLSSPGAVGAITALWSSNNGQTGQGTRATGLCSGEVVQFVGKDENGCAITGMDTVPYPADGCMIVRPVITPGDEDGNNDFMLITCIEAAPDNTVEIYNRWGQLVMPAIQSYHNGIRHWRGRSGVNGDGAPLPAGVYFYVINYTDDEGNPRQIRGHVNLLR